ncbi:unnamed protein product [Arabidopsis arenosa]|uniref:UBA domain-containing protein n=1 Tax=Arabidopsis arenosa TaxID=38785 RepID=A0A8S1ZS32_ARAAE|nr:unnamed protein product [Arabidopsis arenosa]
MDLSSSSSPPSTDFIDLMNNHDDDHQVIGDDGLDSKKEEILPSYDFHPILPTTATRLSHSALDLAGSTTTSTPARVHWSASDFKPVSTWGFGSLNSIEPSKLVHDKGQNATIMSEIIDRTMKKHTDTLLHVMEGVSARLSQLESRTHNLENLVDDLKVSVDNSHGNTDGKIRQLKNILVEVQNGVLLLKDKQEILETKHQVSKVDQHTKTHSLHVHPTAQSPAPIPMPQFPLTSFPQPSSTTAPSQPPSSQLPVQLPTQFSPQQEPYYPPPSHPQPPPPNNPPYQAPQTQTPHQPPYQSPPQQPPPSSGYNPEEQQPYPMQSYSPIPPRQQPPTGSAPSQHFYNPPQPQPSMHDGAGGRSNSDFLSGYSSEPYPYSGSPMASAKPPHINSSGTGYSQLSNSRPLPHAMPMVSAVSSGGGSSSPRSESRAPIDDVIDRVTTMGFPRDQVRATVRKLTENGQAVDLNVVLDKLMNEGGAPPGGWFDGR